MEPTGVLTVRLKRNSLAIRLNMCRMWNALRETKKCLDAGISGYPIWIDADGKKYEGGQGLLGLSKISGCQLP